MPLQPYTKSIKPQPPADALRSLLSQAWRLYSDGELDRANHICNQLIEANPCYAEVMHLKALVQWGQGHQYQATALMKQAAESQPDHPQHYNNLGVFLNNQGKYDQAAGFFESALKLSPGYYDAHCNLGLARYHMGELEAASKCFNDAITLCPDHGPSNANLGMLRLAQGAFVDAIKAYETALTVDSKQASWWGNLGAAYMGMDNFAEAAHAFQQALVHAPAEADYLNFLGVARRGMGDYAGSIHALNKALDSSPDNPEIISNLCIALQQTSQWHKLAPLLNRLDGHTRDALAQNYRPEEQPMFNIWRSSDIALNYSVAHAWSKEAQHDALRIASRYTHKIPGQMNRQIHIGYLSYDFRNHPVAHQLLPLFSLHDRQHFKVTAFSMGPDDGSDYRYKIQKDCDGFIEIGRLSHTQAAQYIHNAGVDILIDLMGHSHHSRPQILALRPAPIQIGYLGFLASSGAEYIDYLLADHTVVPPGHENHYREKLIYMPHCYQMNHDQFFPTTHKTDRKEWGLPPESFVFCCFNSAYKINTNLYKTWVSILKQVPNSVLWLFSDNSLAKQQLVNMAIHMGIDPHRLIFADKIPLSNHIERLQHADLALDTDGYNGGATTANALWAGVPVLSVLGNHWVSRMSASHLMAIDLSDLVAPDLKSYEQKAVELALDKAQLLPLRSKLNDQRVSHPIFDARVFTRDLEAGLRIVWDKYCHGLAPDHIRVSTSACGHKQGYCEPFNETIIS